MNRARAFVLWCAIITIFSASGCLDKGTDLFVEEGVSKVSEIVSLKKAGGEVVFPTSGVKVFLDPNDVSRDVQVQMDARAAAFYGGTPLNSNISPISSYYVFAPVEFSNSNTADVTLPVNSSSLSAAVGTGGVMDGSIQVYQFNATASAWEIRNSGRLLDLSAGTIRVTTGSLGTFVVGYYLHDPVENITGERVLFSSARAYMYINQAGSILSSGSSAQGINLYTLNPADPIASVKAFNSTAGNVMMEDFSEGSHMALVGFDSGSALNWALVNGQAVLKLQRSITTMTGNGFGRASLSPDGTLLVTEGLPARISSVDRGLSSFETTDRTEVFILEIGTGKTERITFNDEWDIGPAFTVDGKGILFTRIDPVTEKASLYYHDRYSGSARRLTSPADNIGGTGLAVLRDGRRIVILPQGLVVGIDTGRVEGDLGSDVTNLLPPTHSFNSFTVSHSSPWTTPTALIGRAARIMSLQETPQGDLLMELTLTDGTRGNVVGAFLAIVRKATGLLTIVAGPEYIEPQISRGFRDPVLKPRFLNQ